MKIVTMTIDGSAKMIWIPCAANNGSNQPPRPNSRTPSRPTITGETAIGRSTNALTRRRPGKLVAGQHERDDARRTRSSPRP